MSTHPINTNREVWTPQQRFLFRFSFLFILVLCIPVTLSFWKHLFVLNWSDLHYGDIFQLAHYTPRFLPGDDNFVNWAVAGVFALLGVVIWTLADGNRALTYNFLYYWIRTIARYRLALAVFAYGFLMFFSLLAPYPSISNLNTAYGDFTRWKLFSLSLGIVPGYQAFLGLVEIACGLLLLYRKTASIGAFILAIFLGNVFVSNIAYEGGETVYSLYLIVLALFILANDAKRLFNLLVLQRPAKPNSFNPSFLTGWQKVARITLKSAFLIFFLGLYGFKTRSGFHYDAYQFPREKGINGISGLYTVESFTRNGANVPYDPQHPWRWKDVVFEEWATLSIRSNRPTAINTINTEHFEENDILRTYELDGTGGRHYYSYSYDATRNLLLLRNKHPLYSEETMQFTLVNPEKGKLVLIGKDYNGDDLEVTLWLKQKKYLLQEAEKLSRRATIKL